MQASQPTDIATRRTRAPGRSGRLCGALSVAHSSEHPR